MLPIKNLRSRARALGLTVVSTDVDLRTGTPPADRRIYEVALERDLAEEVEAVLLAVMQRQAERPHGLLGGPVA